MLFAYLVLNRLRRIDRDELLVAVYGEEAPPDHQARLSVLLSKLRRIIGPELLAGRAQLELALPQDAFHRPRGGARRPPPGRVAHSEGGVGGQLGTGRPRLRRREPAPAQRSRPALA